MAGVISTDPAVPALGTAYCVGLVGSALGGGVSTNQGQMGLLVDLLEEVQLVTARGDLVTASRTLNRDLFWAVRGAGANFGVVTSATFRVPRAVNGGRITQANYMFPSARQRSVWEYLASMDEGLPAGMALNLATFPDGTGKVGEGSRFLRYPSSPIPPTRAL